MDGATSTGALCGGSHDFFFLGFYILNGLKNEIESAAMVLAKVGIGIVGGNRVINKKD